MCECFKRYLCAKQLQNYAQICATNFAFFLDCEIFKPLFQDIIFIFYYLLFTRSIARADVVDKDLSGLIIFHYHSTPLSSSPFNSENIKLNK